tara:strand:- start:94 stop:780 length:687 start_codon:yes stop_codon:yes gene_type:complete
MKIGVAGENIDDINFLIRKLKNHGYDASTEYDNFLIYIFDGKKAPKNAKIIIKKDDKFKDKINDMINDLPYERPSWDEYFLNIMKKVGSRATCSRGRSGCVITRNNQILVTGYVGAPRNVSHCDEIGHEFKQMLKDDGSVRNHCVRTTHAEQNAICQAAKLGISLDGSTLYCTMTPCYTCAKMIINCGIKKVVAQRDYHASDETKRIFKEAKLQLKLLNKEVTTYKNM